MGRSPRPPSWGLCTALTSPGAAWGKATRVRAVFCVVCVCVLCVCYAWCVLCVLHVVCVWCVCCVCVVCVCVLRAVLVVWLWCLLRTLCTSCLLCCGCVVYSVVVGCLFCCVFCVVVFRVVWLCRVSYVAVGYVSCAVRLLSCVCYVCGVWEETPRFYSHGVLKPPLHTSVPSGDGSHQPSACEVSEN